jgi:preprotein translocase subunit YajC
MNEWLSLVAYFAVFIGIFYFLIIMPRKKQEKKHNSLLEALQRGDKVITIGGIKGEITRIKDYTVSLRVNETMQIELLKKAIAYKEGEEPK